ncbi:hypothetical protein, partial [Enterococcus plantarum]|uniref:hypothetical protein n=1 Tax=Enterococcus plantarum TaxID=1077675 RepID=UPI001C64F8D6
NILCWWKSKKIFYQHFFEHLNTKKEQLTDKMKSTKTTNHQKGCSLWIRIPDYCSDLQTKISGLKKIGWNKDQ